MKRNPEKRPDARTLSKIIDKKLAQLTAEECEFTQPAGLLDKIGELQSTQANDKSAMVETQFDDNTFQSDGATLHLGESFLDSQVKGLGGETLTITKEIETQPATGDV